MTPLLTTKGLSRNFGGLRAVDNVDFTLMPGEIRAVIGPNGAGKTTFVSLVSGRIQPSSGMIVFDGADITRLPAYVRVRQGIAYTFQITSVFANLTAYDNVALPVQRTLSDGRLEGRGASRRHGGARTHRPGRPRPYAGRAIVLWPPAPAGSGDGPGAEAAPADPRRADARPGRQRDRQFHHPGARDRQSATVLLIEHNMPVVMQLADRITVFNAGRILAEGTPEAIRENAAVQEAYLGTAP